MLRVCRVHIAISYTANQWPVYYINGIRDDSTTTSSANTIPVPPNYWGVGAYTLAYIGCGMNNFGYYDGYIKDFRIYSRALRSAYLERWRSRHGLTNCSGNGLIRDERLGLLFSATDVWNVFMPPTPAPTEVTQICSDDVASDSEKEHVHDAEPD
jgi:hypothetical protein